MTNTSEQLGIFQDTAAFQRVQGHSRMALTAEQLKDYWRRCSLSSDHWARFYALQFPLSAEQGMLNYGAAESTLSYLLNELFENCAKFSSGPKLDVFFEAWSLQDEIVFQLTNHIAPSGKQKFVDLLNEILTGDPDELYFARLESNAESGHGGSGLGFLTLIKDYGIRFGFKFTPISPDSVRVDVQATVFRKEM